MPWTVHEAYRPEELCLPLAIWTGLGRGKVGGRRLTGTVVECGVSVSDPDRDSAPQFFRVSSSPYTRQGLDNSALAIVHVSESANVNLRLDL